MRHGPLRSTVVVAALLLVAAVPGSVASNAPGLAPELEPASPPWPDYHLVETVPGARAAPGELVGATDLSVAPDGTVYVMDEGAGRIQRFRPDGDFINMWGTVGVAAGEFTGSVDRFVGDELTSRIAVGPTGVVFASDHGFGRIEKFTFEGVYYTQWAGDVGDMTIMPDGTVFLTDWDNGEIRNHCPAGICRERWGDDEPGRCKPVARRQRSPIAVTADNNVIVAHHGVARVEVCTRTGDLISEWTLGDAVPERWDGDMAMAPDGTLVFTGGEQEAVLRFDTDGQLVDRWGVVGDGTIERADAQVSVAPSGDVFLLDSTATNPAQVKRFSADGFPLASWGRKGTGVGQYHGPMGVAIAPQGTIVVADTVNGRLQRYGPVGQHVDTIVVRDADAEERGEPIDVAVGAEGTMYVTDRLHSVVRVFDAEGVQAAVWRAEDLEPTGMIVPLGVVTAPDGTVLVVDELESRVVRFSATGDVLQTIGGSGVEPAVLVEPRDVAASPDGAVYVSDAQLGVRKFMADGAPDLTWSESNEDDWATHVPLGVAWGADDHLLVGSRPRDEGAVWVASYDASGVKADQWDVPSSWMQVRDSHPVGVAAAADGSVYVADWLYDRLLRLDTRTGAWVSWDNNATDAGRIDAPVDIAMAADLTMYVLDGDLDRVQHIDRDGVSLAQWGPVVTYANGRSFRFADAYGITVAADGRVLVTDSTADIYVFSGDGTLLDIWRLGRGRGWHGPLMPAAGPDGSIYVLDTSGDKVGRLDGEGRVVAEWGSTGEAPGMFRDPSAIDVSPYDSTVVVADTGNHRVQQFDADGVVVGQLDEDDVARYRHAAPFLPTDVTVGRWQSLGTMFVAEATRDRVLVLADDLSPMQSFRVTDPAALGARHGGLVYVAQRGRFGLSAYGLSPWPPEWRLSFFDNPWLAGAPVHAERVEAVDYDWGAQAPHETLLPDGWSARFERVSPEGSGRYDIELQAAGGVRFWLDDNLPVDEWPSSSVAAAVTSDTWGPAVTRLEFADRGGPSSVHLEYVWTAAKATVFLPGINIDD